MYVLILLSLILHGSSSSLVEEFFQTLEKFKPNDANDNIVGSSRQSGYAYLEENLERFREFKKSKKIVDEINKDDSIPFMAEINEFSVMTSEERKIHTGLNISQFLQADGHMVSNGRQINKKCPRAVNWNAQGAQVAIKNQGSCASCWAFAGVSSMEGGYYAITGDLISFSDQEVLECSYEGTARPGCKGGFPADAFNWVRRRGGLSTSGDMPYIGRDGRCRKGRNAMTKARITQVMELKHYRQGLKGAVVDGVVSSGIKVTDSFYSYKSGVWKDPASCGRNAQANHALNVVGYGTTSSGRNYWRVRNSWGKAWGDNGHILMCRDQRDNCRIETYGWLPKFACSTGRCQKPQFTEYRDDGSDGNAIGCKDTSPAACSRYSQHCKQGMKYSKWAGDNCKKTCGKCGGGGNVCEDKESWCVAYKKHCHKNATYYRSMVKVCKKTCNLCDAGDGGQKGGCPAGTTRCSDGVCRHVHMCGRH